MLILLIVAISTAAVVTVLYQQTIGNVQQTVAMPQQSSTVSITQASVHNISNSTAGHVRIAVTATRPVNLSHTQLILRVGDETAYLAYRNGTLTRNESTGYYTQ